MTVRVNRGQQHENSKRKIERRQRELRTVSKIAHFEAKASLLIGNINYGCQNRL